MSEKEISFAHWLTAHMFVMVSAGPDQSKELQPIPHVGDSGPHTGTILCYFPKTLIQSWAGSGAVGTSTPAHMGCRHCRWQLYHSAGRSMNLVKPLMWLYSSPCNVQTDTEEGQACGHTIFLMKYGDSKFQLSLDLLWEAGVLLKLEVQLNDWQTFS